MVDSDGKPDKKKSKSKFDMSDVIPQAAAEMEERAHDRAVERSDNILRSFDTGTPSINSTIAPNTRLRIHVPTPGNAGTTLTMGMEFEGVGYRGFGVGTDGNIVMHARTPAGGGSQASTLTLRAQGQVFVQSQTSNLFVLAQKHAMFAAENASLLATKGITIAAGWLPDASRSTVSGSDPIEHNPAGYRDRMTGITDFWGAVDGAVAKVNIGRTLLFDALGLDLGGAVANVPSHALTYYDHEMSPNVTIHAPDGYLLGTDKFGAIYAGLGIDVVAAYSSLLGMVDAEVAALNTASLSAVLEASVAGVGKANLASYTGPTEVACRRGELLLYGRTISIGALERPSKTQQPTNTATMQAGHALAFAVGPLELPLADGIQLVSDRGIQQRAATEIDLLAKQKIGLAIAEKPISVVLDRRQEAVTVAAFDATVVVHNNGVTVRHGTEAAGGRLKIHKGEIQLGFGDSPMKSLTIKSNGTFSYGNLMRCKF